MRVAVHLYYLADAHALGIKLILDWVPNHSSDQHAWFKESRSSSDNPKRDWYVWRDGTPDNRTSLQVTNGTLLTFPVDRAYSLVQ